VQSWSDVDDARYKILFEASDESFLFHLPHASYFISEGVETQTQPEMSIEELRPALRDLVLSEFVSMFEATDANRDLTVEQALTIIEQDSHWMTPDEEREGGLLIYGLVTTPAGNEELRREFEGRQS
jgi:hypothetical protein